MRHASIVRRGVVILASLLILLRGGELEGQANRRADFEGGMRTGIGYSAVIPDVMAGVGAWHLFGSGRFGVFADAKKSFPGLEDDGDYCPPAIPSCTVPDVERDRLDPKLRDVDEYLIFNLGGVIRVGGEIAFLLGIGPVRHARFREYFDSANDPEFLITQDGSYWAPHEPASEWTAQAVVGTLIRLSNRIVLRFGYERGPGGISFGGYWTLSR